MRSISQVALLLTVFAAGSLIAAEPKVYKWTDENGTVHFSAEPPAAAAAEEVKLDKGPTVVPPPAATIAETPAPATPDENAKRCEQHRANLKLLEGSGPLTIDDKGTMRELSAKERADQVDAARRALSQCEAAVAAPATPPPATTTPTPAPAPSAQ